MGCGVGASPPRSSHADACCAYAHTTHSPPRPPPCRSYLQKRVLNHSKGPAVWALRAQTDKIEYAAGMRRVLEHSPNLFIREGGPARCSQRLPVLPLHYSCHMLLPCLLVAAVPVAAVPVAGVRLGGVWRWLGKACCRLPAGLCQSGGAGGMARAAHPLTSPPCRPASAGMVTGVEVDGNDQVCAATGPLSSPSPVPPSITATATHIPTHPLTQLSSFPTIQVCGVSTFFGITFPCKAAVLTTGTFMNGQVGTACRAAGLAGWLAGWAAVGCGELGGWPVWGLPGLCMLPYR